MTQRDPAFNAMCRCPRCHGEGVEQADDGSNVIDCALCDGVGECYEADARQYMEDQRE